MEIKYQKQRPPRDGIPETVCRTIIRHNVFIKDDRKSPDGDRPNVLVGGFPDRGPGSEDMYEIYGNFFWQNPRESLLQASGRVAIHDNVFAGRSSAGQAAITVRGHDLSVKLVHIYNNTIWGAACGIRIAGAVSLDHAVMGNVIFADEPLVLHRSITRVSDNITGSVDAAADRLRKPVMKLGELDLRPLPGKCEGEPLDLTVFANQMAHDLDFDGTAKEGRRVRGAYAGAQAGWSLQAALKP